MSSISATSFTAAFKSKKVSWINQMIVISWWNTHNAMLFEAPYMLLYGAPCIIAGVTEQDTLKLF